MTGVFERTGCDTISGMNTATQFVLSLNPSIASLQLVGGKGRSLAVLAAAGMPVPIGFLVSTQAYDDFVAFNELQEPILDRVGAAASRRTDSTQAVSSEIRTLFDAATLPTHTVEAIAGAYAALGANDPRVAVRSSATSEDLPGSSFAGQHDTFLNVRGEAALLDAIRRCWSSLWATWAIDYRTQMNVDQRTVAMGVVVQVMVNADVSGILFTANPTSGNRSELVVNASFGLGEAIVGGQVTPDTYVVDRVSFDTKEEIVSAKQEMTVPAGNDGTTSQPVPEGKRNESSLSPELLRELAELSLKVERLFDGLPQDIEWASSEGQCHLLQARPITNLPPPPLDVTWAPPSEGTKLIRRQVVENMPEPLSPLFDELYLSVGLEEAIDQFLIEFGMRGDDVSLFLDRPMFLTVNGYAYCRGSYRWSWRLLRAFPKILYAYVVVTPKLLRNLQGQWRDAALPAYLKKIERWKSIDVTNVTDEELLSGMRELSIADANYWFSITSMVAGAKLTDGLLKRFLTSRLVRGDLISGMFLRGFSTKTIEAQVDLETIANRIREDESLRDLVCNTRTDDLLERLSREPSRPSIADDIRHYLKQNGHQIYNLDFVEPTQVENPSAILISLKMLVESGCFDTKARQAKLVQDRDALIEKTSTSLGPIRRWLFRKFLRWAQNFGPCREESLFYMGAAWSILRQLALELGERMVAAGKLRTPDDVFYLETSELTEALNARGDERPDSRIQQDVDQRRELREARKKLHPPGIIPEGSRWKVGWLDMTAWETQKRNAVDADILKGFAVSPGTVTGVAMVILSPDDFIEMKPDTILVCPTTTPAWTPLFAHALGLVTDIGGILAHGSIVAREYGIPAVLGTGNSTRRIVSGQRIRVDGIAGTVTILD